MSEDQLKSVIDDHASQILEFESFPFHTQSVERGVTEAAAAVCGAERRDGYIRARLESRELMPQFETKVNYRTSQL